MSGEPLFLHVSSRRGIASDLLTFILVCSLTLLLLFSYLYVHFFSCQILPFSGITSPEPTNISSTVSKSVSVLKMAEVEIPTDGNGNEVFQAQYIPKQKGPVASNHPSMKAYISTYPALGQVNLIEKTGSSVFTALLEVDEARASDPWQVSLWHSEGKEWREVPMEPLRNAAAHPIALQVSESVFGTPLTRLYFTTPLAIHLPTAFTIKFRGGPDQSWKWVKDHQGTLDGTVILKTITNQDAISTSLEDYFEGLNPVLKSKNYRSQSPGTALWSVEAPVDAADGAKSTFANIKFGLPWGAGKFSRWVFIICSNRDSTLEVFCSHIEGVPLMLSKMVCPRPYLDSMACSPTREIPLCARQRGSLVLFSEP